VVRRLVELQGPELQGGLVFRQFEPFQTLGQHARSGLPLSLEFRLFLLDGQVLDCSPYWEQGDYGDLAPPLADLERLAAPIASRFFTMDVAPLESGGWRIVELGDGQVAGLPERDDPVGFYQRLVERQSPLGAPHSRRA
jgi:hypothetical protein